MCRLLCFFFVFSSSLSHRVFRVYFFLNICVFPQNFFFFLFFFSLSTRKKKTSKKSREEARFFALKDHYFSGTFTSRESESERERQPRASRVSFRGVCGERRFFLFSLFFLYSRRHARALFVFGYRIRERDLESQKKSAPLFSFLSFRCFIGLRRRL